jgi:TPP-dependent pyruvate/acetoin dehydrogenase alpha subunit
MGEMTGSLAGESPLVPNRTMQRMYKGMVESRLLVDLLHTQHGKSKRPDTRGQEACRASALVDLAPEDFISDHAGALTTAFLRGADLQILLAAVEKKSDKKLAPLDLPSLLPAGKDTAERIRLALGVALGIRRLSLPHVVVVFTESSEIKPSLLREHLRFASQESLPVLFVVLPPSKQAKAAKPFVLSARSTRIGVPGIPVDASDAIALYRVAQESIGRARAGGGPALMECIPFIQEEEQASTGKKKHTPADPIRAMGQMLLRRKVCDESWLNEVAPAFQAQLDAL